MSRPLKIYFDTPPRLDRVTLAVVPVDGVTGAVVGDRVSASVEGLPDRPLRNASGMLVFINLPDQPAYQIVVDGRDAGFFGPQTVMFVPPPPNDPDEERKRRREVRLEPRPDYPFPADATLVRGVATSGGAPVPGIQIAARPDSSAADFTAHSDAKGAFALALRLPPPINFDTEAPVEIDIRFLEDNTLLRTLTREVVSTRSHSFLEPVELTGNNQPGFFTI